MWNQSKLVWKWHNDHSKHYVTIFQQNNSIIFSTFTPIFFLKNGLFKFINLTFYNNQPVSTNKNVENEKKFWKKSFEKKKSKKKILSPIENPSISTFF